MCRRRCLQPIVVLEDYALTEVWEVLERWLSIPEPYSASLFTWSRELL
jgi:hypothetical protein